MIGTYTLFIKELLRFWRVVYQTVAAPILSSWLYLIIFGYLFEDRVQVYNSMSYLSFLVPGLIMMSLLQNAFANSSSSILQSRISGNLIFLLLTPLSHWSIFFAYVAAATIRGVLVGAGVWIVTVWITHSAIPAAQWSFIFALLGGAILGTLGLIAGVWAEKFDQLAAFQNFIIMPATFLSGVFYSVQMLPETWRTISHFNPFFYMIDGFRYGFFGISDVNPWISLAIVVSAFFTLSAIAVTMLKAGYKLRY